MQDPLVRSDHLSYLNAEDCDSEIAINISHSRFKNNAVRGKNSPSRGFIETGMAHILNRVVSHQGIAVVNNMLGRPS